MMEIVFEEEVHTVGKLIAVLSVLNPTLEVTNKSGEWVKVSAYIFSDEGPEVTIE